MLIDLLESSKAIGLCPMGKMITTTRSFRYTLPRKRTDALKLKKRKKRKIKKNKKNEKRKQNKKIQ